MTSRLGRFQRDILEDGERALRDTARELGADVEAVQTAPDFRRRLVRRGQEGLVVDLVLDRGTRGEEEPRTIAGVRVDPPFEILANKLCALLSRSELRDLIDVLALERTGLDLARALRLASRKDGGLTPSQLAWVLSRIRIGDDANLPEGYTVTELRGFIESLQQRLTRMAFPTRDDSRTPD